MIVDIIGLSGKKSLQCRQLKIFPVHIVYFFIVLAVNNIEPRIKLIEVSEDTITAYLVDGRTISVPLAWSWRLSDAVPEERNNWELIGDGQGVHWPDIDEDISAKGMLYGVPARHPQPALV